MFLSLSGIRDEVPTTFDFLLFFILLIVDLIRFGKRVFRRSVRLMLEHLHYLHNHKILQNTSRCHLISEPLRMPLYTNPIEMKFESRHRYHRSKRPRGSCSLRQTSNDSLALGQLLPVVLIKMNISTNEIDRLTSMKSSGRNLMMMVNNTL